MPEVEYFGIFEFPKAYNLRDCRFIKQTYNYKYKNIVVFPKKLYLLNYIIIEMDCACWIIFALLVDATNGVLFLDIQGMF